MRVLGVDPGLTRCGWGVIDSLPGRTARLVDVGVVRTPATDPLPERLLSVALALEAVIVRLAPDVVAVERVFAQANVSTVMGTAQAAGIAMMLAARSGLGVALHTPSEVKAAVTGNGRADKAQVTTMVTRILGLDVAPRPADAADALALALCHLWRAAAPGSLGGAALGGGAPGGGVMSGAGAPTAAQSAWAQAAATAARGADRSPIALAARAARRGPR